MGDCKTAVRNSPASAEEAMTRILALDPATVVGYALFNTESPISAIQCGSIKLEGTGAFEKVKSVPPTYEQVAAVLHCEPVVGRLFWKCRPVEMFTDGEHSAAHSAAKWNARYAGKEAFCSEKDGYRTGVIFKRKYRAHRVIWLFVHQKWPDFEIDHVNGVRHDNRLVNLREASRAENSKNLRVRDSNTSGVQGVSWNKDLNKWYAYIIVDGRTKYLGISDEFQVAVALRKNAEIEHGFHPNHGRRA